MIANLLNTLLGLWLVYVAVLDPEWAAAGDWKLPLAGVLVLALALWARASDHRKWQSSGDLALGVLLLVLAGFHWNASAPPLVMFWGLFWTGILVAIFALWAALYRPRAATRTAAGGSAAVR